MCIPTIKLFQYGQTHSKSARAERARGSGATILHYTLTPTISHCPLSRFPLCIGTHSGAWRLMTNDSDLSACFGAPVVNLYCILTVVISASALRLRVREGLTPIMEVGLARLHMCLCRSRGYARMAEVGTVVSCEHMPTRVREGSVTIEQLSG